MTRFSPDWPLPALPLLLAGPVLRRTEPAAVTVWVALRQPCQIRLRVYATEAGGTILGGPLLAGDRTTVAIGSQLHIAAVTARPLGRQRLESDRLYAYDIDCVPPQGEPVPLSVAVGESADGLSYFPHGLPTLVLPPADWRHLRLVHGSCRKPHGSGSDTLPLLDCLLAAAAADPRHRPHQLFFTGDQIYSDDVAEPLLELVHQLAPALLGWHETLPTGVVASRLPPGQRGPVAQHQAGLTASIGNDAGKINSHLLSLGEYLLTYLMSLSPTCWPQSWVTLVGDRPHRRWRQQVRQLQRFAQPLGRVRRALANIPVYAIFDDHDVSDDWNLNQAWCLRVLGRPLGYRVVQNGLLAYALVYGWGNTPEQFAADRPGDQLLAAVARWGQSGGGDAAASQAIAQGLGLPPLDPLTGLPILRVDGDCYGLGRSAHALTWHYTVESPGHQVIVLDTRTRRGYPGDKSPLAPPHLLAPEALETQLQQALQAPAETPPPARLTLVVAPTNVFSLKLIDWIHRLHLRQRKVFGSDVGDAWNLPPESLARLLAVLFRQRQQVIVLSGDIHFSFAVRLSLTSRHPDLHSGTLVQLTASSIANEEPLTRLLHTRLKQWLLPEPDRWLRGWLASDQLVETTRLDTKTTGDRPSLPQPPADWKARLTWVPRQSAQTPAFGETVPWRQGTRPRGRWRSLQVWKRPWLQEGAEAVGRNNLALVQFTPHTVRQDCYWWAPWKANQVVYSRMESEIGVSSPAKDPGA